MASISNHNAVSTAGAYLNDAADAVKNGAKKTGKVLVSTDEQRKVFADVREGVSDIYNQLSKKTNGFNTLMETNGEETLRAPIKGMKDLTLSRYETKEEDSPIKTGAKYVANTFISSHEKVVRGGESFSRTVGDKAHAFTSLLLTPVRFFAKLAQIEVAGAMIQNAIALTVGFVFRGITLAATQLLGHPAIYVGGSLVVGLSPVYSGPLSIATHAQVAAIKKQKANAKQAEEVSKNEPSLARKTASALSKIVTVPANLVAKNKGKAATALVIGGLTTGALLYGVPPVVSQTLSNVANSVRDNLPEVTIPNAIKTAPETASAFLSDLNSNYNPYA